MPAKLPFWEQIKPMPNGCWEWQASRVAEGYGQTRVGHGNQRRAHRVAYELTYGPIPEGMCVLHRCDNPPCCNPEHLFLGTIADNNADMHRKGRHPHGGPKPGEENFRAKLTNDQVRTIRARYAAGGISIRQLTREYPISLTTMRHLIHGKTWKGII